MREGCKMSNMAQTIGGQDGGGEWTGKIKWGRKLNAVRRIMVVVAKEMQINRLEV